MSRRSNGFTLIELMITVAIVATLASIAYPSYMSYLQRSRRADARNALLQIQVAQEKYFLSNNVYASLDTLNTAPLSVPGLIKTGSAYYTADKYFVVDLETQSNTQFKARATTNGSQVKDTHCAVFKISETGDKSGTTYADCWAR